jgi:hypothetical protein
MTTGTTTDPIAETLATLDVLLAQTVTLSREAARLRLALSDLRHEQRLREAHFVLNGLAGKNEQERQANLALLTHCDADYRRMAEEERAARLRLAETEAKLWASRMKTHTCLALLKLAGGQAVEGEGEEGEGEEGEGEEGEGEEEAP